MELIVRELDIHELGDDALPSAEDIHVNSPQLDCKSLEIGVI